MNNALRLFMQRALSCSPSISLSSVVAALCAALRSLNAHSACEHVLLFF